MFGSHGWSGCVCAGVLGFVEFLHPNFAFWGRGVPNVGSWLIPILFQLSFRDQSIADQFACGLGSWVKLGSISMGILSGPPFLQDLLPMLV